MAEDTSDLEDGEAVIPTVSRHVFVVQKYQKLLKSSHILLSLCVHCQKQLYLK